ncbi:MAG: 50S ribosomal protein L13 [Patescibacteria group bacterium]
MKKIYTINAEGRAIGRVASEAAVALLGKKEPDFRKNIEAPVTVEIINAGKLKISSKKLRDKLYTSYSGYPGGLKKRTMKSVIERKGIKEAIIHAVWGMLPKNKLKERRIKNLNITE